MAENLIKPPRSAKEVETIQSRVYNLSKNNDFDELVGQLDAMIDATKTLERQFYNELNCENYQGFRSKLNNINNYEKLLANGEVFRYYSQNFIFPVGAKLEEAVEDLETLLNSALLEDREFYELLLEGSQDPIQELVLDKIREVFSSVEFLDTKTNKSRKTRVRYKGTGGQNVGIAKLTFEMFNKELKIKNTEGVTITRPLLEKIRGVAEAIQKKDKKGRPHINTAFPTIDSFRDDVIKYLQDNNLVSNQVLNHARKTGGGKEIAISRSYAGLKGFLGEVRSIAILYDLFGDRIFQNDNFIKGTGAMVYNKQEIPIDTIVKVGVNLFGFQVKNFTLENDTVLFRGGYRSAYSFIQDRLALTGTFQEIMLAFFGAYQFNQPFTDPRLQKVFQEHWLTIDQYRDVVYNNFTKIMYGSTFKSILDSRLGNVLRVGMEFETEEVFGGKDMYYNSFFFIAGEYIPASTILTNIKNVLLKDKDTQAYWRTSYEFSNPAASPTLQDSYKKGGKVPGNLVEASYKPKVAYEVELRVADLVKEALKN